MTSRNDREDDLQIMQEIHERATTIDEDAHARMLMPWQRTGGPLAVMAKVLASCRADKTPVHAHSKRTWSMNLIENRVEARLLKRHDGMLANEIINTTV